METPVQRGVLIEFVFGTAPFRYGYAQIGSFNNDAPDWPPIYVTAPVEWVNAKSADPASVRDFLQEIVRGFVEAFNEGIIDTSKDRFRYYLMNEDEDTAITLGYFNEEKDGPNLNGIDPLSTEEFLVFQIARDKIAEFHKDTLWFTPIVENCNIFHEVIQTTQENFSKSGRPDYSGLEIVNINSAFNNYLTSITSYLNHMEKKLKNRDDKVYWEQFHKHTSEQYDQNVSYRFLYGLRNYIQHQAPPIHIWFKSELVEEQTIHQVTIYCSKEELSKSEKWNEIQRNDILKMDVMIDISLHVDSMMQSLNQILEKHLQDEFSNLREAAIFIHNLLQRIPQGKDRGVYEMHFSNKKIVGMTPHLMHTTVVEAIVENNIYKILQRD